MEVPGQALQQAEGNGFPAGGQGPDSVPLTPRWCKLVCLP